MAEGQEARTLDDLDRAVRALATHFKCDTTVIVGSQATLVGWPDATILGLLVDMMVPEVQRTVISAFLDSL